MHIKRSIFILALLLLVVAPFASLQAQQVCSSDGTLEELETTFVNDSNTDVTVHWIDTECVEQEGTPIAAGESLQLTTYDGHEFVFRNADGVALLNFMVNTLIADDEVSLTRTIAEGASAGVMWETINPAREELGLEPIYFSGVLYNVMAEAAGTAMDDYAAFGDTVTTMATESDLGWAGNSEGPLSGALLSVEELSAAITASVQEKIDTNDSFGWLDPTVQSFAVYTNENILGYLFSSKSQPTLELENPETSDEIEAIPAIGSITGTLLAEVEMNYYSFEAEAGVLYAVSLTSDAFDTYLHIFDADNVEIASDDDSGDGLNSFLTFTAPADGTYTIGLDSFTDNAQGDYVVSITHTTSVILNFLTADNPTNTETLDVQEGTMYFVSLNSEEFDTYLSILDENGVEIAANDDSGGTLNSVVVFTATSTGTYSINVSSYVEGATGEYNVLIGEFAN